MSVHTPRIEIFSKKEMVIFKPQGLWVAKTARGIDFLCTTLLQKVLPNHIVFDLADLSNFDTTGIWLLHRTFQALEKKGHQVELQNESETFLTLSARVDTYEPSPEKTSKRTSILEEKLIDIGKASITIVQLTRDLLIFLGEVTSTLCSNFFHPKRFRFTSIVSHIERFGVNAIPIIIVMSVALGLVLAYQGEEQLRRFGTEIYTINLVGISVLREVGVLITAILVAGRSGSSITAQIGIMKIRQEIDALNTLGLSPMEVLIIPRIIALILIMPMLAFVSDIAGLVGGGIMVVASLDVTPQLYVHRIGEAVTVGSFWVGIVKAPFFGAIIGVVSCFEGMRVEGTAESIGICTTRSVVEGIFLVTLADALLSVFFSKIGI